MATLPYEFISELDIPKHEELNLVGLLLHADWGCPSSSFSLSWRLFYILRSLLLEALPSFLLLGEQSWSFGVLVGGNSLVVTLRMPRGICRITFEAFYEACLKDFFKMVSKSSWDCLSQNWTFLCLFITWSVKASRTLFWRRPVSRWEVTLALICASVSWKSKDCSSRMGKLPTDELALVLACIILSILSCFFCSRLLLRIESSSSREMRRGLRVWGCDDVGVVCGD